MIYSVDFCVKENENFQTIHTEDIAALSVSECNKVAKEIRNTLSESKNINVYYFIAA